MGLFNRASPKRTLFWIQVAKLTNLTPALTKYWCGCLVWTEDQLVTLAKKVTFLE